MHVYLHVVIICSQDNHVKPNSCQTDVECPQSMFEVAEATSSMIVYSNAQLRMFGCTAIY
jgi:hypothetical protein